MVWCKGRLMPATSIGRWGARRETLYACIAGWLAAFRPVWALGSAEAIGAFPVLPGIEAITVLGETDDGGKNAEQTSICIERWTGAEREAFLAMPVAGDLNTVYK